MASNLWIFVVILLSFAFAALALQVALGLFYGGSEVATSSQEVSNDASDTINVAY